MCPKTILVYLLVHSVLTSALPQNAGEAAAAGASAALAAASSPTSSTLSPTSLPPAGLLVNVTTQTPINGKVSIMTSLLSYSGCNDDQKNAINQEYIDALNIVGTSGGIWSPQYMFTGTPLGDSDNQINPPWDYFGSPKRTDQKTKDQIIANSLSAQAPSDHWRIGDWWNDRYFDITCDDPEEKEGHNRKTLGSATGYEVESSYRAAGGKYLLINFCALFWEMDSLTTRVDNLDKGFFDKNDVRSLCSQGTAFLHEMMHTSATAAGVSAPRCQDVTVSGYPGKAYGPARAKQLARIELGGPEATAVNVDNYVFYACTWYMYQKYDVAPKAPKYAWPRLALDEYYPDDNSSVADHFNSTIAVTETILDDQDFNDGTNYTPAGGFQPAGPTKLASTTEVIPMMVTASPANMPCSTMPPSAQATDCTGEFALQPALRGCANGSIFLMQSLSGCQTKGKGLKSLSDLTCTIVRLANALPSPVHNSSYKTSAFPYLPLAFQGGYNIMIMHRNVTRSSLF